MTQRRHSNSPARSRAIAAPSPKVWRAAAEELRMIRAWWSSRMGLGFEWFLQLGLPSAAQVLEMQNVKRRFPEIGEIDQAVRSVRDRCAAPDRARGTSDKPPRPFAD